MTFPRTGFILLAALLLLPPASAAMDDQQLYYEAEMTSAPFDQTTLNAIIKQQIPLHQAAQTLMRALNFTNIPGAFNRYLHQLHYHLGQLSHNRQAAWTPRAQTVCLAMTRSIALFTQLKDQPLNTPLPVTLLGSSTPGVFPESDCLAVAGVSREPKWNIAVGQNLQVLVLMLPHRMLTSVQPGCSELFNSGNVPVQSAIKLAALHYYVSDQRWHCTAQTATAQPLGCCMQLYKLTIVPPPSLLPGQYHGQITVCIPGMNGQSALNYQLIINH